MLQGSHRDSNTVYGYGYRVRVTVSIDVYRDSVTIGVTGAIPV